MPKSLPRRGEVWLVSFDPAIGGEIQRTRPAVVLSNDTALLNRVQVVPVSSQVGRLYPAEAYITLNGERRKAMADQLATASKLRLIRRLGVRRADPLASPVSFCIIYEAGTLAAEILVDLAQCTP